MSNFTEQAIRKAFVELLDEKPFDKVTVLDIADRCGINRNTFYYHYHDVYELLDSVLDIEEQKIWKESGASSGSWEENLLALTKWSRENERAIRNIYRSVSRDRIENHIFQSSQRIMERYIREQAEGLKLDEQVIRDTTLLYAATAEGLILNWLRGGMSEDLQEFIERMGAVFENLTKTSLERASERDARG